MRSDLEQVGFGSSGVRGLVTELTDHVCFAYTLAFIKHLASQGDLTVGSFVAVGCDLRPSSPRIGQACIAAVSAAGLRAEFCGVLPTPALALHALRHGMAAIMVTGSHIPFDRNGIKFYSPRGEILKPDEAAILRHLGALPAEWREWVAPAPLPDADGRALSGYLARYADAFPRDLLTGWRIGVYQHSSVARDLLVELVVTLGGEAVALGRSDTFVPIDTEAVQPETQRQAQEWARDHRLDAILSTDGDADRPLIGDETGAILRGDEVGMLTAAFLGADVVVTPVSSNSGLERMGIFAKVARTRIGSPYVIAGMQAEQAAAPDLRVVGFEANGGFLTQSALNVGAAALHPLPTRDAVLPMLSLLAMARAQGGPVSALRATLPARVTASGRLADLGPGQVARLRDVLADPLTLSRDLGRGAPAEVNTIDGARYTYADGVIVHFRLSGNAPELRCYVEADTPAAAAEILAEMLDRAGRMEATSPF